MHIEYFFIILDHVAAYICLSDEYSQNPFLCSQYMTEKLKLGEQSSLLGDNKVGEAPFGIPVNIQITGGSVLRFLDWRYLCVKPTWPL